MTDTKRLEEAEILYIFLSLPKKGENKSMKNPYQANAYQRKIDISILIIGMPSWLSQFNI